MSERHSLGPHAMTTFLMSYQKAWRADLAILCKAEQILQAMTS